MIESRLDPGRGPVVTLLIQRGTLKVGDALVAGEHWGRVRAMHDYRGSAPSRPNPACPSRCSASTACPTPASTFRVVENDREARRSPTSARSAQARGAGPQAGRCVSLEDVMARAEGGEKELNLIIKADVAGSLEALADEIARLPQDQVIVNVIRGGVGGINESDVMLAAASDAVILGFNVRPVGDAAPGGRAGGRGDPHLLGHLQGARGPARRDGGHARARGGRGDRGHRRGARDLPRLAGRHDRRLATSPTGTIARGAQLPPVRDGTVIYDGRIASLRRFKDDVREVAQGYECGIVLENYQDIKEGDVIEAYETRQVEQTLPRRERRFVCVLLLLIHLHFPENGSLKGKRKELSSVKAQLQRRFGAAVAETDHHDLWQRSTLTAALVGRDAARSRRAAGVERWVDGDVSRGRAVERRLVSGDGPGIIGCPETGCAGSTRPSARSLRPASQAGSRPPRGFVTVTAVDTSPDLRHARVYVSVLGDEAERASGRSPASIRRTASCRQEIAPTSCDQAHAHARVRLRRLDRPRHANLELLDEGDDDVPSPPPSDQVLTELRQADKLLLTTHENPDGDALGSLLAMH